MDAVALRIAFVRGGVLVVLVGVWLAGCASPGRPPIAERSPVFTPRPEHYTVQAGDTLYSIAWRYELDVAGLARANGLRAPYTIRSGQRIRLEVAVAPRSRPSRPPVVKRQPALSWTWPVTAPVLRNYGPGNKGVDFRLRAGDQVRAAAAGEVVYAGNGLGGFEHLVIIKHGAHYLSAYSLNTPSRVREGQQVKARAHLADISPRGRDALTLHFEIRKDGEAVNPRALIGR